MEAAGCTQDTTFIPAQVVSAYHFYFGVAPPILTLLTREVLLCPVAYSAVPTGDGLKLVFRHTPRKGTALLFLKEETAGI